MNPLLVGLLAALCLVGLGVLSVMGALTWRARSEAAALRARYGPITEVEVRAQQLRSQVEVEETAWAGRRRQLEAEHATESQRLRSQALAEEMEQTKRRRQLEAEQTSLTLTIEQLRAETALLEERADLRLVALYQPIYDFDTPQRYKDELERIYKEQAAMVKAKTAATCSTTWSVDGNARKGQQMVDRELKLMLRAFNGEADAAIAKVRFNNFSVIEARIRKSFEAINKLGETKHCSLASAYLDLKLAELRLTHEHAEKVQADKEQQRQIREQMREEEVAQREIEKAQREAEQEEQRYSKALATARSEAEKAGAAAKQTLLDKIQGLEERLAEAQANKERAISQAQMTRSGHVYVISNEGSFGPGVYKVGMTRRLDPMDRVRELGDASVPFGFDVHAIIWSEDAPALENQLHKALAPYRVNQVNLRKEFFAVPLTTIEALVHQNHGQFEFVRVAVAEEYRKTIAMDGPAVRMRLAVAS
jgi:hypothetical protein